MHALLQAMQPNDELCLSSERLGIAAQQSCACISTHATHPLGPKQLIAPCRAAAWTHPCNEACMGRGVVHAGHTRDQRTAPCFTRTCRKLLSTCAVCWPGSLSSCHRSSLHGPVYGFQQVFGSLYLLLQPGCHRIAVYTASASNSCPDSCRCTTQHIQVATPWSHAGLTERLQLLNEPFVR